MAKVQNPVIGRSKGSAGGMTFAKNHDKNVMRAKAFEVSNPKTAAQVNQRTYFAKLSGVVASFTPDQLHFLFPSKPKAMSRRNALSKQLAEDVTTDNGQKVVDFANIDTIGNAKTMDFGTTTCTQAGTTISVGLDASVKAMTDLQPYEFCAALVNETLGQMALPLVSNTVENGTLSIPAPAGWLATHVIHAIPLITNHTGSRISSVGFGTMGVNERPARKGRNPRTGQ